MNKFNPNEQYIAYFYCYHTTVVSLKQSIQQLMASLKKHQLQYIWK